MSAAAIAHPTLPILHPDGPPRRTADTDLSLDVLMTPVSQVDRQSPLSSTLRSPFLSSPVIGSTLLMSASRIIKNVKLNHSPSLLSPTSPLVMHPVEILPQLSGNASNSQIVFEGQIRPVAVAAYEDLLFLVRIAKWKVAYQMGHAFDRQEQLPYCEWR